MRGDRHLDAARLAGAAVTSSPRTRPTNRPAGALLLACGCLLWLTAAVAAQTTYRLANGPASIVPRVTGFAHADFAEARLSLEYIREFPAAGIGVAPYAGAAARKGESDMFAGFDFNPGWEAGVLGFLRVGPGDRRGTVSIALGYQRTERKLVEYSADSTTVTLTEEWQSDLVGTIGAEYAVSQSVSIGVGASLRREWDSPGTTRAVEVCVLTDAGQGLVVPSCVDRYPVRLDDYWAGQVRADVVGNLLPLGRSQAQPHLAALGAASVDLGQRANARFNAGAGLGIAIARYPGHLMVAALFELHDIANAAGQSPTFADKTAVRLELSIPFDMLLN